MQPRVNHLRAATGWNESWRWMFASQMVVVVLFALFLFRLPPSPRWLAQRGRFDEALQVLVKVHGREGAAAELTEIKEALTQETGGFAELLTPGIRYALGIGLLLAFFNNWTGWSAMGGYIPETKGRAIEEIARSWQRH